MDNEGVEYAVFTNDEDTNDLITTDDDIRLDIDVDPPKNKIMEIEGVDGVDNETKEREIEGVDSETEGVDSYNEWFYKYVLPPEKKGIA